MAGQLCPVDPWLQVRHRPGVDVVTCQDRPVTRGQLRIYLGAAPGVGKTYAMLEEAHRRRERGTDVVVGLVETHGRKHTAGMLGDLEVLPRRTLRYRDADFTELDLDALVARRPEAAVVDEL